MSPHKVIGYRLVGASEESSAAPQARSEGFSRRPTTDVRIQSLLHQEISTASDRAPTQPALKVEPPMGAGLEERTLTGLERVDESADAPRLLDSIAEVDGFWGGAILDAEWGELVTIKQTAASASADLELAAHLNYTTLPTRAYRQHLYEIITTTATHAEITTILDGPFLSLIIYTIWDRSSTNLVLARLAIDAAIASCANKK